MKTINDNGDVVYNVKAPGSFSEYKNDATNKWTFTVCSSCLAPEEINSFVEFGFTHSRLLEDMIKDGTADEEETALYGSDPLFSFNVDLVDTLATMIDFDACSQDLGGDGDSVHLEQKPKYDSIRAELVEMIAMIDAIDYK